MVQERSGAFPEGVRLYLLNKLFQLRPAESAKLEGKQPHTLQGMIIRVSDQLRAGEPSLFEFDQEEAEAAKARLEAQRKQRRERHAKKKEQIKALREVRQKELQMITSPRHTKDDLKPP